MTAAKFPLQAAELNPPFSESLPTMYDLPSEEVGDPGLPDPYHVWQAQLCNVPSKQSIFFRVDADAIHCECSINEGWHYQGDPPFAQKPPLIHG